MAQVVIDPGTEPLFIIATSSESTIWHVSGATERVDTFIHATGRWVDGTTSGVIGLEAERVYAALEPNCLAPYNKLDDKRGLKASAEVLSYFGRPADTMVSMYEVAALRLPSARSEASTLPAVNPNFQGAAAKVWSEGLHFNPDGLIAIAADEVVSPRPVAPYDVWPEHFGLAQLFDQERLTYAEPNTNDPDQAAALQADIERQWKGEEQDVLDYPTDASGALLVPGSYRIVGRMRFPAGLYGAHQATFVLATGVSMPDGNPGHSCVIVEETWSTNGMC